MLFNIYFPCFENSSDYRAEICFYIGFIESIVNIVSHNDNILIGNANFAVDDSNADFQLLKSV